MKEQTNGNMVLQLTVNNHPGVMSHICGLFARRAYNMEAIVCFPIENSDVSRVLLLLNEDERLEQIISQTRKLVDVIDVTHCDAKKNIFTAVANDAV